MRCVPLLPKELGRAEESSGSHLPAHHICPLIDLEGQVAVRLDPSLEHVPDHRFRRWPHDQLLLQLCVWVWLHTLAVYLRSKPMVRDDSTFLGKTIHMLSLLAEERHWNEQWEVRVLRACCLDTFVKILTKRFPYRHAIRLDYHTPFDWALIDKVGSANYILVPLVEVSVPRCHSLYATTAFFAALFALLLSTTALLGLLLLLICLLSYGSIIHHRAAADKAIVQGRCGPAERKASHLTASNPCRSRIQRKEKLCKHTQFIIYAIRVHFLA
mmetsp:Transcript_55985/g.99382  ORF Transcript_55985/g.99382 Transcript_55985/m.99382 type:complete len:271 (-) Transcript_55985:180-992(-)